MKRFHAQSIKIAVLCVLIANFHIVASATTVVSTIPLWGAGPVRIALSPTRNHAYVSNRDSDLINVIDTTTHTVIAGTFVQPSPGGPHGLAVTPDGSQVWVANRVGGTINIIDVDTFQVVGVSNVGGHPDVIVFSQDGTRAYIPNTAFGLGVYSVPLGGVAFGFIPAPSVQTTFLLSDDGRVGYLGVVDPDGSNLRTRVIDLTSFEAKPPLAELPGTWLTLFNQNAATGWGLNPNTNTVSLVHVPRLEIRTNIPVSSSPQKVALSVNGKRLYVVSDVSNEVRVYSASNGQLIETVTVSGRPTDIVLLPDGVTAYVTQSDTGSIAVLSLE